MRNNIAIIGLSSFGFYLCKYLSQSGVQVMAIDTNEDRIEQVKTFVKKAIVANATEKTTLQNIHIEDFDAVVISVGEKIDQSVLITLHLRELGVKEIYAKATTTEHAKVLTLLGVSDIIFPERDIARRFAHTLRRQGLFDYFSIGDEYSVIELAPPQSWIGKTLSEIKIRQKYNVQVIVIKEIVPDNIIMIPSGRHVLKDSDILVILGKEKDIEKIETI
ncbi:TrkA family potassium uptake protein [candidate division KSB1 bacterium]|nr:TrkA family potassium uptake protein [candidate division KSB1 bacterium]